MKKIWTIVERVLGFGAVVGLLIQTGRILERLDQVEAIASEYVQTVKFQGYVTPAEHRELMRKVEVLREFHLRNRDI